MKNLDRKLFRDLWHMKGQVLAIAMVLASGVATFIMSISTVDSLTVTRALFYRDSRFADVFASLKRAPESLADRIERIEGVEHAELRIVASVNLDIEGYDEPATGTLLSVPDSPPPHLNSLYFLKGRTVDPVRDDEVVISEAFAEAHRLEPGNILTAIINGKRKRLSIVGIAVSPEYIYQIQPGNIVPDFKNYGILWMAGKPLSRAFDMDGAFNDVALTLRSTAVQEDVIDRLDILLKPYGGLGAYGREDQLSDSYLTQEFKGLEQLAAVFPAIFLGVAAFLLHVVTNRLVSTQRDQIAILKAFGYRKIDIGMHYLKFVILIVSIGLLLGVIGGAWLGRGLSTMYMDFFRFPVMHYGLRPGVVVTSGLLSLATAVTGTLRAVLSAASLPPAEAMRPVPAAVFRRSIIERLGFRRAFSQPFRIIMRNIEKRPVKSILSVIGISLSCSIMMIGSFQEDAIDHMIDVQYGISQKEDITVQFNEPASRKALYGINALPGVRYVEPYRAVHAELSFRHRKYRTAIIGIETPAILHRPLDSDFRPVPLPPEGVIITDYLAEILRIAPGERVTVEVFEGTRPVAAIPVAGIVSQYIGVSAYMEISALNRLMGEGSSISGVYMSAEPWRLDSIYSALKKIPRIASTIVSESAIENFYDTWAETILIFTFINSLLAAIIAFGVVYNSARISLSERSRELASLRVLGYTRGEISYILLGELGLLTIVAIPIGFAIGYWMCAYLVTTMESDLYRIPLVVEASTYSFAATVVLVSALVSGLIVRRKLDHLDLVAVLKTKE